MICLKNLDCLKNSSDESVKKWRQIVLIVYVKMKRMNDWNRLNTKNISVDKIELD